MKELKFIPASSCENSRWWCCWVSVGAWMISLAVVKVGAMLGIHELFVVVWNTGADWIGMLWEGAVDEISVAGCVDIGVGCDLIGWIWFCTALIGWGSFIDKMSERSSASSSRRACSDEPEACTCCPGLKKSNKRFWRVYFEPLSLRLLKLHFSLKPVSDSFPQSFIDFRLSDSLSEDLVLLLVRGMFEIIIMKSISCKIWSFRGELS